MPELESLALLIADLNTQVRMLQQENTDLREKLVKQEGAAKYTEGGGR